jgi:ferritin-like metal-binding protein YciE
MTDAEKKIVQYLHEAHAMERALVRVLQSQIAMTPRGSHRNGLESHLLETRAHAERVQQRLRELGQGSANPIALGIGLVQTAVGQALALGKAPLDLVRGSGREEKVLKNAKDTCAAEALETATYTALERLARDVGDGDTATLAASILADDRRMLEHLMAELPKLTDAVVEVEVGGTRPRGATGSGAAGAVRSSGRRSPKAGRQGSTAAKRGVSQARRGRATGRADGRTGTTASSARTAASANRTAASANRTTGSSNRS